MKMNANRVYAFLKSFFTNRTTFNKFKFEDLGLFFCPQVPTTVLELFIQLIIKHDWMKFSEFKSLCTKDYAHETEDDFIDILDKVEIFLFHNDVGDFDENHDVFLNDCKRLCRETTSSKVEAICSNFRDGNMSSEDGLKFIEDVNKAFFGITKLSREDSDFDVRDTEKLKNHILDTHERLKAGKRFTLGLFDDFNPPFMPGDFIVVQAEPKMGKSTFKREVACRAVLSNLNGIFISTEMDPAQNTILFSCAITGLPSMDVLSTNIVDRPEQFTEYFDIYENFFQENPEGLFSFVRTTGELADVHSLILKYKNKFEAMNKTLDYIVLDHILDLRAGGRQAKSNQEVFTEIIGSMYDFGKQHRYITLTSQHLRRDAISVTNGVKSIDKGGGFGTSAMEKKATFIFGFTQTDQQKIQNQVSGQVLYTRFGTADVRATFKRNLARQIFVGSPPIYRVPCQDDEIAGSREVKTSWLKSLKNK
jgi:hypothetical protein